MEDVALRLIVVVRVLNLPAPKQSLTVTASSRQSGDEFVSRRTRARPSVVSLEVNKLAFNIRRWHNFGVHRKSLYDDTIVVLFQIAI
jgi:hypothetical protein